jgi:hypothetical protein
VTILAHVSMQTVFTVSARREAADILIQANGVHDVPATGSTSTRTDGSCLLGTGMCDCRSFRDWSSGKLYAQMTMDEIEKIIRAGKVVV